MAGLVSYSLGGLGFLSLSFVSLLFPRSPFSRHVSSLLLSSLFLLYSFLSLSFSSSVLPLPLLSLSLLFLLHSLSSLLLPLPSPLLSLLSLSSFLLELLLLLLLRRLHPVGIESRYFTLLSVPVLLCLLSSLPLRSPFPLLSRAAGLFLHGTWLIQMGFSLFSSSSISHGCFLTKKSWSDYSVRCQGDPEYHRARALATLQFNCHLALLVVVGVAMYALVVARKEPAVGGSGYRPIGKEVQMMAATGNGGSHFVLDDEEDEEEGKVNGLDGSHS